MALKYCQSHKCHTYDTKDRKRGSKENRTNQTRRRSNFYYGKGNFCSLNCYNDWADQFMDRAIDSISGRLHEPLILNEQNAWRKVYNHRYWHDRTLPRYVEVNMISGQERPCEQQVSSVLDERVVQNNSKLPLFFLGGPAQYLQAHKLSRKLFLFLS